MTARPTRLAAATAALACLVGAVVALAGCGSGGDQPQGRQLPRASVTELTGLLEEVRRRYDAAQEPGKVGACDDIANKSFPAIRTALEALPEDVDGKLRDAVNRSFTNLQALTEDGCTAIREQGTETETTETAPPPQTETAPPQTETAPPQTETAPPQTETAPPQTDTPNGGPSDPGGGGTAGGGADDDGGGGAQAPGGP